MQTKSFDEIKALHQSALAKGLVPEGTNLAQFSARMQEVLPEQNWSAGMQPDNWVGSFSRGVDSLLQTTGLPEVTSNVGGFFGSGIDTLVGNQEQKYEQIGEMVGEQVPRGLVDLGLIMGGSAITAASGGTLAPLGVGMFAAGVADAGVKGYADTGSILAGVGNAAMMGLAPGIGRLGAAGATALLPERLAANAGVKAVTATLGSEAALLGTGMLQPKLVGEDALTSENFAANLIGSMVFAPLTLKQGVDEFRGTLKAREDVFRAVESAPKTQYAFENVAGGQVVPGPGGRAPRIVGGKGDQVLDVPKALFEYLTTPDDQKQFSTLAVKDPALAQMLGEALGTGLVPKNRYEQKRAGERLEEGREAVQRAADVTTPEVERANWVERASKLLARPKAEVSGIVDAVQSLSLLNEFQQKYGAWEAKEAKRLMPRALEPSEAQRLRSFTNAKPGKTFEPLSTKNSATYVWKGFDTGKVFEGTITDPNDPSEFFLHSTQLNAGLNQKAFDPTGKLVVDEVSVIPVNPKEIDANGKRLSAVEIYDHLNDAKKAGHDLVVFKKLNTQGKDVDDVSVVLDPEVFHRRPNTQKRLAKVNQYSLVRGPDGKYSQESVREAFTYFLNKYKNNTEKAYEATIAAIKGDLQNVVNAIEGVPAHIDQMKELMTEIYNNRGLAPEFRDQWLAAAERIIGAFGFKSGVQYLSLDDPKMTRELPPGYVSSTSPFGLAARRHDTTYMGMHPKATRPGAPISGPEGSGFNRFRTLIHESIHGLHNEFVFFSPNDPTAKVKQKNYINALEYLTNLGQSERVVLLRQLYNAAFNKVKLTDPKDIAARETYVQSTIDYVSTTSNETLTEYASVMAMSMYNAPDTSRAPIRAFLRELPEPIRLALEAIFDTVENMVSMIKQGLQGVGKTDVEVEKFNKFHEAVMETLKMTDPVIDQAQQRLLGTYKGMLALESGDIGGLSLDHSVSADGMVSGKVLDGHVFRFAKTRIQFVGDRIGALGNTDVPVDGWMHQNRFVSATQMPQEVFGLVRKVYPEAFKGEKVNVNRLRELEQERPLLETHVYGQDGSNAIKAERDQMMHEWYDTLDHFTRMTIDNYVYTQDQDSALDLGSGETELRALLDKGIDKTKLDRWVQLNAKLKDQPDVRGPRATSYYHTISPFDTKKYPVVRIDVTIPTRQIGLEDAANLRKTLQIMESEGRQNTKEYRTVLQLYNRKRLHPESVSWRQDDLHENLPNTLGWAMVQFVPDPKTGETVMFVAEQQSRWGQESAELKKAQSRMKVVPDGPHFRVERDGVTNMNVRFNSEDEARQFINQTDVRESYRHVPDHPLLDLQHRLVLKAAMDEARKRGVTKMVVSDGETAMMTETHDTILQPILRGGDQTIQELYNKGFDIQTNENSIRIQNPENGHQTTLIRQGNEYAKGAYNELDLVFETPEPTQSRGMRQHYDNLLQSSARRMTGGEGVPWDGGVHKNTSLGSPVFRNPDGTPKTNVTGKLYNLNLLDDIDVRYDTAAQELRTAAEIARNPVARTRATSSMDTPLIRVGPEVEPDPVGMVTEEVEKLKTNSFVRNFFQHQQVASSLKWLEKIPQYQQVVSALARLDTEAVRINNVIRSVFMVKTDGGFLTNLTVTRDSKLSAAEKVKKSNLQRVANSPKLIKAFNKVSTELNVLVAEAVRNRVPMPDFSHPKVQEHLVGFSPEDVQALRTVFEGYLEANAAAGQMHMKMPQEKMAYIFASYLQGVDGYKHEELPIIGRELTMALVTNRLPEFAARHPNLLQIDPTTGLAAPQHPAVEKAFIHWAEVERSYRKVEARMTRPHFSELRTGRYYIEYDSGQRDEHGAVIYGSRSAGNRFERNAILRDLERQGLKVVSVEDRKGKDQSDFGRLTVNGMEEMAQLVRAHYNAFKKTLRPDLVEELKAEGFDPAVPIIDEIADRKTYMNERKFAPGREYLDMLATQDAYFSLVSRKVANYLTRMHTNWLLKHENWNQAPELRTEVQSYKNGILSEGRQKYKPFRKAVALMTLGFNVSSGLINLSQPITMGMWRLAEQIGTKEAMKLVSQSYIEAFKPMDKLDPEFKKLLVNVTNQGLLKTGVRTEDIVNIDDHVNFNVVQAGHRRDLVDVEGLLTDPLFLATKVSDMFGSIGEKVVDVGLIPQRLTEQLNNKIMLYAGLQVAKQKGLTGIEAENFAINTMMTVNVVGGRAAHSSFKLKAGKANGLVEAATLLTNFPIAVMSQMYSTWSGMLKNSGLSPEAQARSKQAFAGQMIVQFAAAGSLGFGLDALFRIANQWFGVDPEDEIRKGLANLDESGGLADALLHGVFSRVTGADMASRFSLTGVGGFSGYDGFEPAGLFGAGGSLLSGLYKTPKQLREGRAEKMEIVPIGIRRILGTISGTATQDSLGQNMIDPTGPEKFMGLLGFRPKRLAEAQGQRARMKAISESEQNAWTREKLEMLNMVKDGELEPVVMRLQEKVLEEQKLLVDNGAPEHQVAGRTKAMYQEKVLDFVNYAVDKMYPYDPMAEGGLAGVQEREQLAKAYGNRLVPRALEVQREMTKQQLAGALGVRLIRPRAIQEAQKIDQLRGQNPGMSRSVAKGVSEMQP